MHKGITSEPYCSTKLILQHRCGFCAVPKYTVSQPWKSFTLPQFQWDKLTSTEAQKN